MWGRTEEMKQEEEADRATGLWCEDRGPNEKSWKKVRSRRDGHLVWGGDKKRCFEWIKEKQERRREEWWIVRLKIQTQSSYGGCGGMEEKKARRREKSVCVCGKESFHQVQTPGVSLHQPAWRFRVLLFCRLLLLLSYNLICFTVIVIF